MSISRLQASLAQATNEVTVAAANINFDFCLVKYEAPKEYRPIGKLLSTKRKQDAEHGVSHVTARRLAALFGGVCPKTPSLIEAYGARVSEISQRATDLESKECSESVFGLYTGVDATSIWAAATSSEGTMTGAIHVHLLACMLSSMFDAAEATSIWVELVEERRRAVALSWERDEKIPFSTAAAAAQQEMSRSQLADWDASARAWLQTADSIMRSKQTQLRLILKNVNLSMGGENKVFSSVIETWVKALQTMERLIAGIPQEVQDGSAIIGLAAWHIYPNISVFGSRNVEVHMDDALVAPGGVLSLGCSPSATTHMSGVSWALSLTQYKYYGQPVRREGSFKPDPTRITFKELLLATLGAILSHWNVSTSRGETTEALRFIILLSRCASGISQSGNHRIEGLRLLSKAADECLKNEDASLPFLNLGRNRAQFISAETQVSPSLKTNVRPFFGLTSEDVLLRCMHDGDSGVEFLRRIAGRTPGLVDHPCIIQYIEDKREIEILSYATVFESRGISAPDQPLNKKGPTSCHARWLHIDPNESEMTGELVHDNSGYSIYAPINRPRLQCVYRGSGETRLYHWYGDSETAGIYISKESRPTGLVKPKVTGQDLLWCLENDLLSVKKILQANDSIIKTMQYLSVAYEEAFETIDGPVVKVQTLEKPLLHANCITSLHDENSSHQTPKTCRTVSILAYLVAGHDIPSQRIPNNVFGVSVGDSIFVPNQLLRDPMTSDNMSSFTRILGNIGKPGLVMFFSVQKPMVPPPDSTFWRVVNPQKFDGTPLNLFQNTSMHLSFTNWERPVEGYGFTGDRDVHTSLMESVISIREQGQWIGDVNVMAALKSPHIYRLPHQKPCGHSKSTRPHVEMTSVESWNELREFRSGNIVVRASGNWLARLATTAFVAQCAQRDEAPVTRITLCPPSVCWKCMESYVEQFPTNIYIY